MPYSMKFAKKAKIKIKFQKMKSTFLDSIPWLNSKQPPLLSIYYIKKINVDVEIGGIGGKDFFCLTIMSCLWLLMNLIVCIMSFSMMFSCLKLFILWIWLFKMLLTLFFVFFINSKSLCLCSSSWYLSLLIHRNCKQSTKSWKSFIFFFQFKLISS